MKVETITENATLLIRRLVLQPNEAMYWHTDTCKRFTVVVSGSRLSIEFLQDSERIAVDVFPGMTGWDEPDARVHRAVNTGAEPYEEVVTFYKQSAEVVPQPVYPKRHL